MNADKSAVKDLANKDGSVDQAKGKTNETLGKIKQKVGSLIGDNELEAKGAVQNADGKAQKAKGEVKEAVHDTVQKVKAGVEVAKDKVKDVLKR